MTYTYEHLLAYLADTIHYQVGKGDLRLELNVEEPSMTKDVIKGVLRAEFRLRAGLPFELQANVLTAHSSNEVAALLENMFNPFRDQLIEASTKVEEEWAKEFPR